MERVELRKEMPVHEKKDTILERLQKRYQDRKVYIDGKQEERNKENLENEGVDKFAQTFTKELHAIEEIIEHGNHEQSTQASGDAPNQDLAEMFGEIPIRIQQLQNYLTSSTMFLSDYKIKSCQKLITELRGKYETARKQLVPKKKFGFSGKKFVRPLPKNIPSFDVVDEVNLSEADKIKNKASIFAWTISNQVGTHIVLSAEDVNGKDITISNLRNCFVELQGHAGSVQISDAANCTFLCGPVARSIFAENVSQTTMAAACQQLRLHSSKEIRLFLHVTCRAIIEDCNQIEVTTYNYTYDGIDQDFEKAGLDKARNNYTDIADFNWLSPDVHSPNWALIQDFKPPNWDEMRQHFVITQTKDL